MNQFKHYGDYTVEQLEYMSTEELIEIIQESQNDNNFIIMTDSYKMTHHLLYPDKLQHVYSYMEPRGGDMPYTVPCMLQYYLKKYFAGVRITPEKIEEARAKNILHFGFDCFDDTMWYRIWHQYGGRLPLRIKAVPEGTPIAVKNVILTIENTDDECAALTNVSETLLMKLWAPNTVAAYARIIRELIFRYREKTSDAPQFLVDFMHHDFGYRGVSSEESARILAAAGLSSGFKGTDTLGAISLAEKYYDEPMAGFSVIASEHSVMCSYGGKDRELEAYSKIIQRVKTKCMFVNPASGVIILSLVSDTYNIYNVADNILFKLAPLFIGWKNAHDIPIKIVLRPDSGDAELVLFGGEDEELVKKLVEDMNVTETYARNLVKRGLFGILFDRFTFTENSKGYRVLHPQIGVLQGDGISLNVIKKLYLRMDMYYIDTMNLVLGSGGKYLQVHDRDEQKYAIKATQVTVDFKILSIEKNPITDAGKKSKHGKMKLSRTGPEYTDFETILDDDPRYESTVDFLEEVFFNGGITKEYTFDEIRKNSRILKYEVA